jgi:excalibur calcium-binding domain-containing protein
MTSLPHNKPPLPDVVHADIAGAEKRLRELKGGFKRVSNKWDRGVRARQALRRLRLPSVAAIGSFGFFWYLSSSPWPPTVTLRHLAAFPNCAAAKMVGLAPSRRGQPGYWDHHDADGDGIACEASRLHTRHSWVPYQLCTRQCRYKLGTLQRLSVAPLLASEMTASPASSSRFGAM